MSYSGNDTYPADFDDRRANTTITSDLDVTARELDFVTRFGRNWDALREIMGIMRPIRKAAGTRLRAYTASVTLEDGAVPEGAEIPYSHAEVDEALTTDITMSKYAKAVSIEAVAAYGADVAIAKTDEAFLNELQDTVMTSFYGYLDKGTLTDNEATFQMAVAMAVGNVRDHFKKVHKNYSSIVAFVNTLDAYRYLGSANITVQTMNGIEYVKNFMGADAVILSSEIDEGKVYATASENIVLYYIDPADSDFAKLGLVYTVAGETNLIGFHVNGNYGTAVGETYAIMGMSLWAEDLGGIAVITIGESEGD